MIPSLLILGAAVRGAQVERVVRPQVLLQPEGHADEPADLTATREVREEVGAEIAVWFELGEIYSEALHKKDTVTVLLGEWPGGELQLQDSELAEAAWFALGDLPDRLAFEAEFALERLAARCV